MTINNLPITDTKTIKKLIPHREPIIMIDGLLSFVENSAKTTLNILQSNIFVENSYFNEMGLIEHMAQSAALYTGYKNYNSNVSPKEGFIANIKNFKLEQLPLMGKTITTNVTITYASNEITMVSFTTFCEKKCIATAEMSMVLKQ